MDGARSGDEMDLGLKGKVAMVGGASRGLGFAVARALAARRRAVSIASRDGDAIASRGRRHSPSRPARARSRSPADLSRPTRSPRGTRRRSSKFGGVDLLFANTGGPPAGTALVVRRCGVAVRVRAAPDERRADGAAGGAVDEQPRRWRDSRRHLVVGERADAESRAVERPAVGRSTSLAKTLSLELAPQKIRVNTLMPGRIDTDRLQQLDEINAKTAGIPLEEHQSRAVATIPLGRYGAPDDFGRVGAFLLSDAASYITGASVQVDGGLIKGLL